MPIEEAIKKRIVDLIANGTALREGPSGYQDEEGYYLSDEESASRHHQDSCAWLAAVHNVFDKIPGSTKGYMQVAERIFELNANEGKAHVQDVGKIVEMLQYIQGEIAAGLLSSLTDQARAETFDTFLDHGKDYLIRNEIREAGVIVGVVFEDTVRRLCRRSGISENDVPLDQLISALNTKGLLTSIKAKRARAAAAVRTSATHARWEEFERRDIEAAVGITEELISTLDG